jgi:cytochrome c peroxidase
MGAIAAWVYALSHVSQLPSFAMPTSRRCAVYVLLITTSVACTTESTSTAATPLPAEPPTLVRGNSDQAATVGASFFYDVTQGGSTFAPSNTTALSISISLDPANLGLVTAGGRITGTPTGPGILTATVRAVDSQGREATDRFRVVVFGRAASTPVPNERFAYADGATGITPPPPGAGQNQAVAALDNTPITNPTTDAGAALGRVLFYDVRLSANDQVACASCHLQAVGFADTARLSRGFNGARTGRHSMPLGNARYWQRGTFFWDARAASLEAQVLMPIQDTVEMGLTLDQLETKLRVTSFYGTLFAAAFGSAEITRDRISRALAQFVRSMSTFSSPYDRALVNANGRPDFAATLGASASRGQALFVGRAGCSRCHTSNAHVSDNLHNTGLDATITDVGAGNGRFKAPSLRNVGVRMRFMHDGRFSSLEQVVEFYDSGVRNNPGLDQRLGGRDGQPNRLGLSQGERADLVAFLRSLTDSTFLRDPRFASPFERR